MGVRRVLVASVVCLPILAGCEFSFGVGDDPEGPQAVAEEHVGDAEVGADAGSAGGASAAGDTNASGDAALPRGPGDPCEEVLDRESNAECDTVGWVDLDGDGVAEPIGVAMRGHPTVTLYAVVDGETLDYDPTRDQRSGGQPVLGPDVGTAEALRHAAFAGAYDLTGDDLPEIVMWVDKGAETDEFRVLRLDDSGLTALDTPFMGLHSGGNKWVQSLAQEYPTITCSEDSSVAFEGLFESQGEFNATEIVFDDVRGEFTEGDRVSAEAWSGEVPSLGIDCENEAEHAVAPEVTGPGLRCPAGRTAPTPQSDHLGSDLELLLREGDLDCDEMTEMWREYESHPKDPMEYGMALIVPFDDHTCSTGDSGQATRDTRNPRLGGCTQMDEEWAFDLTYR